jgi:hypothetical protein
MALRLTKKALQSSETTNNSTLLSSLVLDLFEKITTTNLDINGMPILEVP